MSSTLTPTAPTHPQAKAEERGLMSSPLDMPLLHATHALAASGVEIPAPNIYMIDAYIAEYESAQRLLASAKAVHDIAKAGLIALVSAHGAVPQGADQSKRLVGQRNVATVTTANSTVVDEQAINDLGVYCAEQRLDSIFDRLFATEVKHKLIDGARSVLATLQLPKRTHEKILSLFGRCIDIKPKAPSLKVEVIEPEKPARKPRAAKAVA